MNFQPPIVIEKKMFVIIFPPPYLTHTRYLEKYSNNSLLKDISCFKLKSSFSINLYFFSERIVTNLKYIISKLVKKNAINKPIVKSRKLTPYILTEINEIGFFFLLETVSCKDLGRSGGVPKYIFFVVVVVD